MKYIGEIRASLESKGQTMGPLDMLIAAHALSLDLFRESRTSNVKIGNWRFFLSLSVKK